ncbi:MAG TPA: hypothetical protein PKE29_17790 [Phycisphaerales bacterium]|nr:hypothetical protein [Phycisphaerales bacterium]
MSPPKGGAWFAMGWVILLGALAVWVALLVFTWPLVPFIAVMSPSFAVLASTFVAVDIAAMFTWQRWSRRVIRGREHAAGLAILTVCVLAWGLPILVFWALS